MTSIRVPILMLVIALCGCATSTDGPTFSNAPVPDLKTDKAILYIYRENTPPTAFSAYLEIDGKEVVSLSQQGFTWIYVTPGLHIFKYGWPLLSRLPSVRYGHVLDSGKMYAFELESMQLGEMFRMAIEPTNINFAEKRMLICCRYVQPKEISF